MLTGCLSVERKLRRSASSWSVIVSASPSGISETSLSLRSSTWSGRITTRSPSAVFSTRRSAVSSTGRPVRTRPSSRPIDEGPEVVADGRARVQDRAEEFVTAVLGADRREVGADPLPAPLDPVAPATAIGPGPEEHVAALLGVPFLADHVEERRQRASPRPFGCGRRPAAWSRRLRSGLVLRRLLASVFRSSGSFLSLTRVEQPLAAVPLPGDGPERLAADAERVARIADHVEHPRERGTQPGERTDRRLGGRAGAFLPLGFFDQALDQLPRLRVVDPRRGLDGGGLQLRRRLLVARHADDRRGVLRVAGRGGQGDGFEPKLGVFQRRLGQGDDLGRPGGVPPGRHRACGRAWRGSDAVAPGRPPCRRSGRARRPSWRRASGRARRRRLAEARGSPASARSGPSSGRTAAEWSRQARPSVLESPEAGSSGVPVAMNASLRSTGKYGGRATLSARPASSRSRSP